MTRPMLMSLCAAAALVGAVVTFAFGQLPPHFRDDRANPVWQPGRYALLPGKDGAIYCIDTASAHVWSKLNADASWQYAGNPATETEGESKKEKAEQP